MITAAHFSESTARKVKGHCFKNLLDGSCLVCSWEKRLVFKEHACFTSDFSQLCFVWTKALWGTYFAPCMRCWTISMIRGQSVTIIKKNRHQAVFFPANLRTLFAGNALIHRKSFGIWTKMLNYLIVFMFKVQFKLHNQVSHTFQLKYETFSR